MSAYLRCGFEFSGFYKNTNYLYNNLYAVQGVDASYYYGQGRNNGKCIILDRGGASMNAYAGIGIYFPPDQYYAYFSFFYKCVPYTTSFRFHVLLNNDAGYANDDAFSFCSGFNSDTNWNFAQIGFKSISNEVYYKIRLSSDISSLGNSIDWTKMTNPFNGSPSGPIKAIAIYTYAPQSSHIIYIDDLAINLTGGGYQTGFPGAITITGLQFGSGNESSTFSNRSLSGPTGAKIYNSITGADNTYVLGTGINDYLIQGLTGFSSSNFSTFEGVNYYLSGFKYYSGILDNKLNIGITSSKNQTPLIYQTIDVPSNDQEVYEFPTGNVSLATASGIEFFLKII